MRNVNDFYEKAYETQVPIFQEVKKRELIETKEIKNEQVVKLHFERQLRKLQQMREDEKEAVRNRDVHQLFLKGLSETFQRYLKENGLSQTHLSGRIDYTPETEKEIDAIQAKYDQQIQRLKEKEKEVRALLSGCETYRQEMVILHSYAIVNYNPECGYAEMVTES